MPGYARDPNALTIASAVSVNPSGNIQTNNVQSALYELDNEKLSTVSASSTYAVKTPYQSASASTTITGQLWVDSDNNNLYVYNGSSYVPAGGAGATGGGNDKAFYENDTIITTDYTITAGKNAGTFGPVTINNGITVTIPSGSIWVIL